MNPERLLERVEEIKAEIIEQTGSRNPGDPEDIDVIVIPEVVDDGHIIAPTIFRFVMAITPAHNNNGEMLAEVRLADIESEEWQI